MGPALNPRWMTLECSYEPTHYIIERPSAQADKTNGGNPMARCVQCQRESNLISSPLEVCVRCLREHFSKVKSHIDEVHTQVRGIFGLPSHPPRAADGLSCSLCGNHCQISEGGRGYCGTRYVKQGMIRAGGLDEGHFASYYDPLPTNCVTYWVCPGGTDRGFSRYSYAETAERGYKNLAVFFKSCTYNCLFCQNWQRSPSRRSILTPLDVGTKDCAWGIFKALQGNGRVFLSESKVLGA